MSGLGFLPAMTPGMALRLSVGVADFASGEVLGETVGRRAERADTIRYFQRKRDNALLVAARNADQADHARSIARGYSVAIDDMMAGLHEGEALVSVQPTACALPYPFTHHRTMAEVSAEQEATASCSAAASRKEVA